uniref:C3H1-type domain-containing protein n=1 Tax=Amphimedon queenslandica TaxID=400682 RepID=A0A1X7TSI2_AMPQE
MVMQEKTLSSESKQKGASNNKKGTKTISSSRTGNNKRVPSLCREYVNKGSCSYGSRCRYRHPQPTKQVCRHFLASNCRYGDQCKFLHPPRDNDLTPPTSPPPASRTDDDDSRDDSITLLNTTSFPSISSSLSKTKAPSYQTPPTISTQQQSSVPPVERTKDHRQSDHSGRRAEPLTLDAFFKTGSRGKAGPVSAPVARAPVPRPKRAVDSSVPLQSLRDIEIKQLTKRYYGDQHQLVEKSPDSCAYVIKFSPTDPEWIENKYPSFDIKITFPSEYPCKPCKLEVVNTGVLSIDCIDSVNNKLEGRMEDHQLANRRSGQHELMLRPILHWLDNNAMRLIPQTSFLEDFSSKINIKDEDNDSATASDDDDDDVATTNMKYVSPVKRGTELRLVDIKLSEGVGTIQMSVIKVTVECSRCKCRTDLLCKENKNDRQKYVNSEKKTVSMKNERVGVKGKNNIDQKSGTLRS